MSSILIIVILLFIISIAKSLKITMNLSTPIQKSKNNIIKLGKLITTSLTTTSFLYPKLSHAASTSSSTSSEQLQSQTIKNNIDITEIVFFRHAQSYNNLIYEELKGKFGDDADQEFLKVERRKLRQSDCTLSKKGFQQQALLRMFAQNGGLKKSLGLSPLDKLDDWAILSSPMRRCLLTSQALSKGLQKPVYVHPMFYESGGNIYIPINNTYYSLTRTMLASTMHLYTYIGCYNISPDGQVTSIAGSTASEVEREFTNYKCLPGMMSIYAVYYNTCGLVLACET